MDTHTRRFRRLRAVRDSRKLCNGQRYVGAVHMCMCVCGADPAGWTAGDSDSDISRGMMAVMFDSLQELTPQQILEVQAPTRVRVTNSQRALAWRTAA